MESCLPFCLLLAQSAILLFRITYFLFRCVKQQDFFANFPIVESIAASAYNGPGAKIANATISYIETILNAVNLPSDDTTSSSSATGLPPSLTTTEIQSDEYTFSSPIMSDANIAKNEEETSPYGRLQQHIDNLNKWLMNSGAETLSCLSSPLCEYQKEADLANSLIIELFTLHRSSRLQPLLNFCCDKQASLKGPNSLSSALTTLIMAAFGISESVVIEQLTSPFRNTFSLVKDALCASRDLFFCDMILSVLLDPSTTKAVFAQGIDCNGENKLIKTYNKKTAIVDEFLKNDYMTSLPVYRKKGLTNSNSLSEAAALFVKNFKSLDEDKKIAQIAMFENQVGSVLFRIKKMQVSLWPVGTLKGDLKKAFPLSTRCTSTSLDLTAPASIAAPGLSPTSNYDAVNTTTTGDKSQAIAPQTSVTNFSLSFDDDDRFIVSSESEYTKYNYSKVGPASGTFLTGVIELRVTLFDLQLELDDLMTDEIRNDLFNIVYELSNRIGFAGPGAVESFKRLQRAYRSIIPQIHDFEDYCQEYEKGFVLYQACRFVEFFKTDFESVFPIVDVKLSSCTDKERYIALALDLREYINRAALWASNLKDVYKRYAEFDNAYRKKDYNHRVSNLLIDCSRYYELFEARYSNEMFDGRFYLEELHNGNNHLSEEEVASDIHDKKEDNTIIDDSGVHEIKENVNGQTQQEVKIKSNVYKRELNKRVATNNAYQETGDDKRMTTTATDEKNEEMAHGKTTLTAVEKEVQEKMSVAEQSIKSKAVVGKKESSIKDEEKNTEREAKQLRTEAEVEGEVLGKEVEKAIEKNSSIGAQQVVKQEEKQVEMQVEKREIVEKQVEKREKEEEEAKEENNNYVHPLRQHRPGDKYRTETSALGLPPSNKIGNRRRRSSSSNKRFKFSSLFCVQ